MTVYSHSRLSTFEQCPQRFKFRYIDNIQLDWDTVESFLGKRVHEALERLYKDVSGGHVPSLQAVLDGYEAEWGKLWKPSVVIVREEYNEAHYRAIGLRCLENYYRRFHPFNQTTTLGLEKHIEVNLDARREYRLQGYIDRLATFGNGIYEIHDYKTSRVLPESPADLKDRQLGLYELGIREEYPDAREIRLVWHFLTQDHDIMISTTEPYLKNLREETIDLIRKIERETSFPPKVSALCGWCEYGSICPAKRHEISVAGLAPEALTADEGVKLVDEYAEADRAVRELEAKKESLKDRLIRFARAHKLVAVQGSECQATLVGGPKPKFVTVSVSAVDYQALVLLIKKDPALWERVADLNTNRLHDLLEAGTLSEEWVQALQPFLRDKGNTSVKLKYPRLR